MSYGLVSNPEKGRKVRHMEGLESGRKHNRRLPIILGAWIILASLLGACTPQPASLPQVLRTPQLATTPYQMLTSAGLMQTPTRTGLDLATVLKSFPLYLGKRWVYTMVDYTQTNDPNQIIRDVRLVEDQVTEVQHLSSVYIAHVHREISQVWADSEWEKYGTSANLGSTEFWYVIQNGRVYLSSTQPDWTKLALDQLSEELVYPLTVGSSWCPNKIQKDSLTPVAETPVPCAFAGLRTVLAEESYQTQAGNFDLCYQMSDFYNSGSPIRVFCEGVGFVSETYDHGGSRFGYSKELVAFSSDTLSR